MASIAAILYILIFVVIYGFLFLLAIANYVFYALSIKKLCDKLSIDKGFLGFVPIASEYKLGQIADTLCKRNGENKNYAKTLVITEIIALVTVFGFCLSAFLIGFAQGYGSQALTIAGIILVIAVFIVYAAAIVVFAVFNYITHYKIYKYTDNNPVLFIILSIFTYPTIFLAITAFNKKPLPEQIENQTL